LHLVVSDFGTFLGKKSGRLLVRREGKVLHEIPFDQLEQVTVTGGGVSLSTDVIRECVEVGVQFNFLSSTGKPYAKVTSPLLTGTVITRREQVLAFLDHRGVELGKAFVEGKLRNQVNVLRYFAKHRRTADRELYEQIYDRVGTIEGIRGELEQLDGSRVDEIRGQLLSIEGRAAHLYWQLVQAIVPPGLEFDGRERQGATDPFNSMLNYGYGILYTQIWGAVTLAGLEPFAGFLHVDRPGKPSLVLDMIEEFRQQAVDRAVIALVNRGYTPGMEDGKLDAGTRKELSARVLERLEGAERYEGKQHRLRTIVQMQARRIATFLRGEGPYRPFVGTW